ncbi:hypothetical protein [Maribacter sp. ACAM166]|uniref:hypothetical protein n=1 Tax=Maribacter sp. ACAM166 TaxID=2508996 RepID=UPI0010FD623D|nr:hypothetical protein [Maribacter sp. ACAM166]TLP82135.1 hypothetical protein ES765_01495 [Maribacter sp. ACAM166]
MKLKTIYTLLAISTVGLMLALGKSPNVSSYVVLNMPESKMIESEEAYGQMMDVLTHQRCMNCHPNDNIPKQGDDRHAHYFGLARGKDDTGFEATNCTTCHQSENNDYSGVPGAPHWSLAPASMGWEGLTRTEIAERLLDKSTNGNRSHEELVEHMTEDELVLWAWTPGVDANGEPRELPPVSKDKFKKAVKSWFENGAVVPTK